MDALGLVERLECAMSNPAPDHTGGFWNGCWRTACIYRVTLTFNITHNTTVYKWRQEDRTFLPSTLNPPANLEAGRTQDESE
jgi:hypothetical protein